MNCLADLAELKRLPQIDLFYDGVIRQGKRRASPQNLAGVDYISAVDDGQSLTDVVVRDEDSDPGRRQPAHDRLDVEHRERVDSGERLIEQEKVGGNDQAAGDFDAAPLSPRQRVRAMVANPLQAELGEELVGPLALRRVGKVEGL